VQFTNLSQNASTYLWTFGDGGTSTVTDPSHFYKKTGTYTVCLVARTTEGCTDTVCKTVEADIHTAVDIPTGFSPNGDGNNDVLYVRGGAIETMNLKIFNRWGEMVFESSDLAVGWDGTYKGKPQEMDAYAYVLDVTFVDGTSARKKGNVTLLR
jgi:gliding motility-associated-like protein